MSSPQEKRNLALLAGGIGLLLAGIALPAQAGIIAYEPFAGTAGELAGQVTGGSGFSGAWTGTTGVDTVVNDNAGLEYTDANGHALVQSGYSVSVKAAKQNNISDGVQRAFTAAIPDSGTYYVSAVIYVGTVLANNYFGFGLPGTNGKIVLGQASTDWSIYNWDTSGPVAPIVGTNRAMAFLVAKITKGSIPGQSAVTLWVNPILGNEIASGTGTTGTVDNNSTWTGISTPVYTQAQVSGSIVDPGNYMADVRVGTTFADVTPFAAIPEPASLALLGLGALAFLRRRRA